MLSSQPGRALKHPDASQEPRSRIKMVNAPELGCISSERQGQLDVLKAEIRVEIINTTGTTVSVETSSIDSPEKMKPVGGDTTGAPVLDLDVKVNRVEDHESAESESVTDNKVNLESRDLKKEPVQAKVTATRCDTDVLVDEVGRNVHVSGNHDDKTIITSKLEHQSSEARLEDTESQVNIINSV